MLLPSETVHAGLISFLANTLSDKAQADTRQNDGQYNSQNIALLEAPLSLKLAIGGGDIDIVDDMALAPQAEENGEAYQSDQISLYVVRDGDTLSQIAEMFNVSVNTIIWANNIDGRIITPGQNLVILPVSGIRHIVKQGDTIESIAKQHKGDLKEILQFNELSADAKLAVGDVVIVPNVETGPTSSVGSGTKSVAAGYFIRPISGGRKTQGIHGRNGVDLASTAGANVFAAAAGKVIVSKNSGYNGGYGNYVVISHSNGTQTLYAHLKSTAVTQGQSVSQGQVIGYEGSTGRSTGDHLHFEVRGGKNPF